MLTKIVATALMLSACNACASTTVAVPGTDARKLVVSEKEEPKNVTIGELREQAEQAKSIEGFDELYDSLKKIPRVKDEFETTPQFEERQRKAVAAIGGQFLVPTPVDMKYAKYDADNQVLNVEIWAFQNYSVSRKELGAAIGLVSDLSLKHKIDVKHDVGFGHNIMWSYKREEKNVGQYVGKNAFGAEVTVTKQEAIARTIFDRDGSMGRQHVWGNEEKLTSTISDKHKKAFSFQLTPDEARAMKAKGFKAAVLVSPKFPYFANGTSLMTPTRNLPIERMTDVRVVIADIQALILYDTDGNILAVKKTN